MAKKKSAAGNVKSAGSLLEKLLGGKKDEAEKPKPQEPPKKKPNGAKFKLLKTGGYLVNHYDEHDAPMAGEEHAVADLDGLHDHLEQHFGEPNHDEGAVAPPKAGK